jgi:hypothetical protein
MKGGDNFGASEQPESGDIGARLGAALANPAIAGTLIIAGILNCAVMLRLTLGHPERIDFSAYYVFSYALRTGINPYVADLGPIYKHFGFDTSIFIHANLTPPFLLFFLPFTLLPPLGAYWAWFGSNASILLAVVTWLSRDSSALPRAARVSLIGLMFLYSPLLQNLIYSQAQIIVLGLLAAALILMQKRLDAAAGVAIAIAGLLRAFPLLMIGYLVITRRWRSVAFALATLVFVMALTVALMGMEKVEGFVAALKWFTTISPGAHAMDVSAAATMRRLFNGVASLAGGTTGRSAWAGNTGGRAAGIAGFGAEFAIFAFTLYATWIRRHEPDDHFRLYSLWIASSILLSPMAWPHYMTVLIIAFVMMFQAAYSGRVSRRACWMAVANVVLAAVSFELWSELRRVAPANSGIDPPLVMKIVTESNSLAMLSGYVSAYWFAIDA